MKTSHLISVLAIWLVFLSPLISAGVGVDIEDISLLTEQDEFINEIDDIYDLAEDDDPEEPEDEEDGEDEDDDDIDDDFEESNERSIEVEFFEDEAVIVSKLRTGDQKDEIKMKLKTENYFEIKVEYKRDTEASEIEVEFEIVFTALLEYVDDDNNSVYSEGDRLLRTIPLTSFNAINYSKTQINTTTNLHYFQITTTDNVLTFHVYFVEEFHLYNEVLLVPTQSKIDIEIANFQYNHSQSQLGLLLNMESEAEYNEEDSPEDVEKGFSKNEQWLESSTNDISGFFSWNKQALIDGYMHNVSVEVYSIPGENEQQISIFYPRGTNIYHDPKIGVAGILQPPVVIPPLGTFFSDNLSVIIIIIAGLVGLFGLIMSKQEYRDYLLNRIMILDSNRHRLSMEDVLENEFRNIILNLIIDQPGIHYSELLRLVDTSSSNLAWHLDILENYKIISKKRVGRFLIFYPYLDKNPFAEFDPNLIKSKTTLDIFQIIGDNPGIIQARIAKRMELNRKTISYHLEKLNSAGLINIKKIGRKSQIYPRSLPQFGEE
jgi:predicted transcriptional regulator